MGRSLWEPAFVLSVLSVQSNSIRRRRIQQQRHPHGSRWNETAAATAFRAPQTGHRHRHHPGSTGKARAGGGPWSTTTCSRRRRRRRGRGHRRPAVGASTAAAATRRRTKSWWSASARWSAGRRSTECRADSPIRHRPRELTADPTGIRTSVAFCFAHLQICAIKN